MPGAKASIEFGYTFQEQTAGTFLKQKFNVENFRLGLPIGIKKTDQFLNTLSKIKNSLVPEIFKKQRGRLVDSYIDSHKYTSGKKAIVYGDQDFVVSMASFLCEIGIIPVICASGESNKNFKEALLNECSGYKEKMTILNGADFIQIEEAAQRVIPDIIIGNSKGFPMSKKMKIPLLRVGFPIHDRFGAGRIQTLGYNGTLSLLDRIVNKILEKKQMDNTIGYSYL